MITLKRAQMRYNQSDRLDITIKSAVGFARAFAPTWRMVMEHKKGEITDTQYTAMYSGILALNAHHYINELEHFAAQHNNNITFVCYCPDGKFCHTHLLIDYLVKHYPAAFRDGR